MPARLRQGRHPGTTCWRQHTCACIGPQQHMARAHVATGCVGARQGLCRGCLAVLYHDNNHLIATHWFAIATRAIGLAITIGRNQDRTQKPSMLPAEIEEACADAYRVCTSCIGCGAWDADCFDSSRAAVSQVSLQIGFRLHTHWAVS